MLLSSLKITAYRNFLDLLIEFDDKCTVIVGENNSGKTNVLDALYASLRANRNVRQGAFELLDYHLLSATALAGDAGPIHLTVTFKERPDDRWSDELVAVFSDVINQGITDDLQSIVLQVTSEAAKRGVEERYDWSFLDPAGNKLKKDFEALAKLQLLRPLFALDTIRDVTREFSRRSRLFGAFINDPVFAEDVRENIVESLNSINSQVLGSHVALETLRQNLSTGNQVVNREDDTARIEAVPSRLSDLLANTQVSFMDAAGVSLPLDRQGSGTQSLSILSLFRAYVEAKLLDRNDPLSKAIVTIEEPEAHLHPTATRTLWSRLLQLSGQSIISTHSGDLVSEVPIQAIRRLAWDGNKVQCYKIDLTKFSENELRQLNYQIRLARGELLFARKWLLVEGRTEISFLPSLARLLGNDLTRVGVRFIEYSQFGGPEPWIKFADQLGIDWLCIADGDADGSRYVASAMRQMNGRSPAKHIFQLSLNLDALLCKHGFYHIYRAVLDQAAMIAGVFGTDDHFIDCARQATKKTSKEVLAFQVIAELEANPLRISGELIRMISLGAS